VLKTLIYGLQVKENEDEIFPGVSRF